MFGCIKKINDLKKENSELKKLLKASVDRALVRLEELEQHKLYYMVFDDLSSRELEDFKIGFDVVKSNLRWSVPKIVILSKPLNELDLGELEDLVRLKKNSEVGKK